jgi:hypothetical protein
MAKKVEVSLEGIGKQIDRAEKKLSAAARKVKNREEKKRLAAGIRALKKAEALIKVACRGTYSILVPSGGPGK